MFTTLTKLKASHAQKDRVAKVERWLKSQNPNWKDTDVLPIFAIGHSNPVEDVDWVVYNESVHHAWPAMQKKIAEDPTSHMEQYVTAMRRTKAKTIADLTTIYNNAYTELHPAKPSTFFASAAEQEASTQGATPVADQTASTESTETSQDKPADQNLTDAVEKVETTSPQPEIGTSDTGDAQGDTEPKPEQPAAQ